MIKFDSSIRANFLSIIENRSFMFPMAAISIALTWYRGVIDGSFPPKMWLKQYFDHSQETLMVNIFSNLSDWVNTPVGTMLVLISAYILFLWLFYLMLGLRGEYSFLEFVTPMLSISAIGIALGIVEMISDLSFEVSGRVLLTSIVLMLYCVIAVVKFKTKAIRSILAVLTSFVVTFIFGGYSVAAPFFHWL